jgi:beta-lactamase superfamily II metal-dependent hydrolase
MRIEIFDVGHGQCAGVTSPNGQRMLVDCGTRWNEDCFWVPSLHYFRTSFGLLTLTNLDEDHLADFGFLTQNCTFPWIATNPSVGPREFTRLKENGVGAGAQAFARWLSRPALANASRPRSPQPDFGPVEIRWYWNPYQPGLIDTTNNLSLVVIVQYGLFKIAFTGDLEAAGWKGLLLNPNFRRDIAAARILVASHHGRESGCCTELFDLMRPEIVIISDDERQYDSQDTDDWYRQRCLGIPFSNNPFQRRYVMTTRKDGSMQIDVGADGRWLLTTVTVSDWPRNSRRFSTGLGIGGLADFGNTGGLSTGLGLSSLAGFNSRQAG